VNRRDFLRLSALTLAGCNASAESERINYSPTPLTVGIGNGPTLSIYFESSIPVLHRFEARDAAAAHLAELPYLHGLVQSLQQAQVPNGSGIGKRVYVHAATYLRSPYGTNQERGYLDVRSPGKDLHVSLGDAREVPDLLHQLVHSLWYPLEVYDDQPAYVLGGASRTLWDDVREAQGRVVRAIRFQRGYP
jgi:hypothetical protein